MSAWFASTAVGRLWEHTVSWCQGQKLIRELSQMPRDETERILHDVGLSMSDMPALTHPHAGPTVLLPQRLELLGLDPAYFEKTQPGTMHDLQLSCVRCGSWRRCARDLAHGDVQAGLDSYCLNAHLLDSFLLNQGDQASAGSEPKT